MAQKYFPYMVALDWLQLSLRSWQILGQPENRGHFVLTKRSYGCKQYENVFIVEYADVDGILEPFGTFNTVPHLKSWNPCNCSLKLDNHLLYREDRGFWSDLLREFLHEYALTVINITRADIAADFLYLTNRVSAPQMIKNIKACRWWKCGTTKVAEHYKLPYSISEAESRVCDFYDTQVFFQDGSLSPRVETLTFGTMSSDAQVCIYDKTLELRRSEVEIKLEDRIIRESAKEYIRDCHKQAGVYHERHHTWRIEIRLKNTALFLVDSSNGMERPVMLEDLDPNHIGETYLAALDRYFKLVDATNDGDNELSVESLRSMAGHKNRMPRIELFPRRTSVVTFIKKPYHEPANKFHRDVINRLSKLGDRMQRIPAKYTDTRDPEAIASCMAVLPSLAEKVSDSHKVIKQARLAVAAAQELLESQRAVATSAELAALRDCQEMLERHYNTESPGFAKNIGKALEKYADKLSRQFELATSSKVRRASTMMPSDGTVLMEAAAIMRGVFTEAAADQRRADNIDIHGQAFRRAVNIFNVAQDYTPQLLDTLYTYVASSIYIDKPTLLSVLDDNRESDFNQWLRCNFDFETFHRMTHFCAPPIQWTPPLLRRFDYRPNIPGVQQPKDIEYTQL